MNLLKQTFLILALFFLTQSVNALVPVPVQVVRLTPQGVNVPENGQIIIEFNQPMIKFRKTEQTEWPIIISPEVKGDWVWLNEKTLSLNIDKENGLKKATKYTVIVKSGLKSLKKSILKQEFKQEFVTSLPQPRWFEFKTWETPTKPVIRGAFDQAVKKESLEKHLFFIGSKNRKIPVRITPDESDEHGNPQPNLQVARYWIIEAAKGLYSNTDYQLVLEPGLLAAEGTQPAEAAPSLIKFKTFDKFKLVGFRCQLSNTLKDNNPVVFTKVMPQKINQRCNPLKPIELLFTSPIKRSQLKNNLVFSPDPTGGDKEVNIWGDSEDYSQLENFPKSTDFYAVRLPYGLKAATEYIVSVKSNSTNWLKKLGKKIIHIFTPPPKTDLQDEFGRFLDEPFDQKIMLGDRNPNFVIAHHNAILEKQIDSDLPLYVNNLKSATFTYQVLTCKNILAHQIMRYTIPKVHNVQFAIPFKIREMLRGKSGVVYGALNTNPQVPIKTNGHDDDGVNTLFAQVTPYQVQVKVGHFNTLIWVTDLATGNVVKGAKVTLYPGVLHQLKRPQTVLTTGITNSQGIALLDGQEKIDPDRKFAYSWGKDNEKLFVLIEKEGEMALLPLISKFEIDTYRASGEKFWSSVKQKYQYLTGWGTTAQGVYRAGDKIQYKFYIRNQNNTHFVPPPSGRYDLEIIDPTNKVVHEMKDIRLNKYGAFDGELTVSESGAVGWYRFEVKFYSPNQKSQKIDPKTGLKLADEPTIAFSPMQVLVSDFTPSPFKVTIEADGVMFQPHQEITLTTAAKLHAGGAYTDVKAEITAVLQGQSFHSKHPIAEDFFFGSPKPELRDLMIVKKAGSLNNQGDYVVTYKIPDQPTFYGKLLIEGKVTDDRGKSVAANKMVDYIGGNRLVGLRQKQWIYTVKKPAVIETMVVDEKGSPVSGTVDIKVEKKDTSVAKVKTAGNVYKTNANHEWKEVAKQSLKTTLEANSYQFVPETAGVYRITATTQDNKQRVHHCELEVYVTGSDFVVWGEENDTYLPIIPEKSNYQVGETARFLIKNPYPHSKALITVERFGVMDTFVQDLDSNSPIIEIPVKPDYLPNFYVSVTAFSPRVDQTPVAMGQLDLSKPTFRIGYAKINVKDHYKEIVVTAKAEKEIYKPRDKVKVEFTAALKHPSTTAEPIELAVVVIDDAVFDLITGGRHYYDPYQGFYIDESLGVRNFSLLNGLVGRMKFEKKGANPGGGGGVDLNLRNIFKFVSYWNPSLPVDANGKAEIEFNAPDNLSGWRIFAIAMTPTDRMGLGEGIFKVNKPTELRPVMPNQINEGDYFKAGFNVMNRTDKTRKINVSLSASGPLETTKDVSSQYQETITLEPFKRTTVYMPVQVSKSLPKNQSAIEFKVRAGDDFDQDQLVHLVIINRQKNLETVAVSGSLTASEEIIPLSIPAGIFLNQGGVKVSLSPSVINNIAGVFHYMKDYPYSCWEQKISRAVVAAYYKDLKGYIGNQLEWSKSEEFTRKLIEESGAFQAPDGGMAYFRAKDDYVDPFLSAFTALSFGWLTEQGYQIPPLVEERLLTYLAQLLKQDFVETYYSQSMVANTRAIILEALSLYGKVTIADLERFLPQVQQMNAYGKSSFARAAMKVDGGEEVVDQVVRKLLSHFNETVTQMTWAEDLSPTSLRILDTPLRETCSALDTLTRYSQTVKGKQLVGDKAVKLARTVIAARKSKLHWENTQENLYCARALAIYSKVFEDQPPQMNVVVAKAGQEIGTADFNALTNPAIDLTSSFEEKDLGKDIDLSIKKQGTGRLYYTTRLQYAPQLMSTQAVNAGLQVRRDYSRLQENKWVLLKEAASLQRGDLVRVDLYVIAPADRTFVVVNDPIPGCLEPVNKNLATASILDQRKLDDHPAIGAWWYQLKDWVDFDAARWAFYHKEMRHESVRFYADYLPKGNYYLSYVAQVIADGDFSSGPTQVEEMYTPETYGRGEPAKIHVASSK